MNCDSSDFVRIEKLSETNIPDCFSVKVSEYSDFLLQKALFFQKNFVTDTFLLIENSSEKVIGYISLICDLVSLTAEEKEINNLTTFPFSSFSALKIAQLARAYDFQMKYKHIGSYLIDFAMSVAFEVNTNFAACRFLTVDADIENNPSITEFYKKNGFQKLSDKKYTKKTKICCMWRDILN